MDASPSPVRPGSVAAPAILVGASVPRSGHHFLESVLRAYWQAELRYCGFYDAEGCCKAIPCTRRQGERVIFQKNHDWQMAVPLGLEGVAYVVQYRHPVPAALSDWERLFRRGRRRDAAGPDRSRAAHGWYLAGKARYMRRFHAKWLKAPPPGAILVEYDQFRADPAGTLAPIFAAADGQADPARLAAAIAATAGIQAATGEPYRPRRVEESSLPHPDLMAAFEAHVLAACPGLGYRPMLAGPAATEEFLGLMLAHDEATPLPPEEAHRTAPADRLLLADRLSGGHPEVRMRLAAALLAAGRAEEALVALEALVAAQPGFARGWRALFGAARRAGRQPSPAVLTPDAAFAMLGDAEVLGRMGKAWLRHGEAAKAVAMLAMAIGLHPQAPGLRAPWAAALLAAGRVEEALAAAREAAAQDPADRPARAILVQAEKQAARHAV